MKNNLIYRLLVDLLLFFCIIQGFWFIVLPIALVLLWLYPYYLEIIIIGSIYDVLFGIDTTTWIYEYAGTIISIFAFIIITAAKTVIRK